MPDMTRVEHSPAFELGVELDLPFSYALSFGDLYGSDGIGGPPVSDPLTLRAHVGVLWADSEKECAFEIPLSELLADCLSHWAGDMDDEFPDDIPINAVPFAEQIRDALRAQADAIDGVIQRSLNVIKDDG